MGWIGCVRCEKFRATSWHELSHQVSPFCTELCNTTERCQLHKNSIKHYETWVLGSMGWMGMFVAKNSNTTSWHEHLHQFSPFCIEFCKATKRSKCIQIVQNTPKHEFRVQWGGSVAFIAKNSNATSWPELLHQFGPFCTEFCNATERCQMHKNSMKQYQTWVLGSIGWMGTFVAKNSDTTSWHELLHHFGPFCIGFCKATKWSRMHPNSTIHTKTWV